MNALFLNDKDFLQQVWLDNPTPIVARLHRMAMAQYDELEDWHIMVSKNAEDAKEKIGSLQYTIDCNEEELNKLQAEIDRLNSRPIDELLRDVADEFEANRNTCILAERSATMYKKQLEVMKEKLGMWTVMTTT